MGPFSLLEVERIALRRFVVKFTVSTVRGGFLGRNVVTFDYEGAGVRSTPSPGSQGHADSPASFIPSYGHPPAGRFTDAYKSK